MSNSVSKTGEISGDTATLAAGASLSSPSASPSRPCPYLGSRKGQSTPFDRPSRENVCYAKERTKFKKLRRIRVPYTAMPRSRQADLCLGSFPECSLFQEKFQSMADEASLKAKQSGESPAPAADRDSKHRSRKKRRKSRTSLFILYARLSKGWKTAVQMGAALVICTITAFGLFLFMADKPSSYVEYIFMTVMRNDIKAFGMKHLGVKDKFGTSGGMITGGNLRSMKNMSESAKRKLKQSGAFKGLTKTQKARLRKQFKSK